jgi:transposase-like protein
MNQEPQPPVPQQLAFPGLPGKCPHCGAGAVDLDAVGDDTGTLEADRWRCRSCGRVWWQLSTP